MFACGCQPGNAECRAAPVLAITASGKEEFMSAAANPTGAVTPPRLPDRKKNKTGWIVSGLVVAVAVIVAVSLIIVNLTTAKPVHAAGVKPVIIKIGTSDTSQPYWEILKKKAAANGITLEVVGFSDYQQPNPALQQKQTDLNSFQHLRFLAQYNVDTGNDLEPIASTIIVPLGLYSQKWKSVSSIPAGGTIAIPNDPSNQARALFMLQSAKLLTLKGDKFAPTPADIDASKSKVKVVTVDAAQTVLSLPSVDGSVINNNFLTDAKIDPHSAIFADDPKSPGAQPYINLIVARAADINNPKYLELAKLYHDPEVLKAVAASSKGTGVVVTGYSGKQLRALLKKIEAQVKANK
jgi:D-methionine transport system substrate-binding protein